MLETVLKPDDTQERCGVILKDGTVLEINNVAPEPENGFEMDAAQLLPHIKADAVASFWHTHPLTDPTLSGDDHACFMAWPQLTHFIVGRRDGAVAIEEYRVEEGAVLCV